MLAIYRGKFHGEDVPVAARYLKKELRREFPGTKFSVRSGQHRTVYDTKEDIYVIWHGGPSVQEVERVAKPYEVESIFGGIATKERYVLCMRK